jgi:very-short-patch-repair endonuclease
MRLTEAQYADLLAKRGKKSSPPVLQPRRESKLESRFAQQLADNRIFPAKEDEPMGYVRNYFPIDGRDWELDFAFPRMMLAVEVDGMAHRTKGRWKADFEKHAALTISKWVVLRVCGDDIRNGRAIKWTMQLLGPLP